MLPLMLALLLQLLNFTGDNAFSFNVTPGTDLTLNFKGFGADDKIQVVQTPGSTPPRFSLVIGGSGLIKYGAFQKIKAATVQQSGNTLTFTPASDGPRVVVVRLPSAMPVRITQNGVTMPFSGELYIEGSYHSQEKMEFQRRLSGMVKTK